MVAAIKARGLSRSYLDHTGTQEFVFNNADFEAELGALTLIMGKSGSGKSTLLNLLALIDPISNGELFYFERAVHVLKPKKRARERASNIGFIFQQFALINEFSICDNVAIPMVLGGSSWRQARQKAMEIIEQLIPGINLHKKPHELSGGQQQRVAIARALVNTPSILIADEPTGNLDDENAMIVWDMISKLVRDQNMACIIVTHDERFADKADRLYRFEFSSSKDVNESNHLRAKSHLVRVYG